MHITAIPAILKSCRSACNPQMSHTESILFYVMLSFGNFREKKMSLLEMHKHRFQGLIVIGQARPERFQDLLIFYPAVRER